MNSTFGWSVNDLVISPTRWLDNRANRQLGTIFATRMLINFFSTTLAKYGKVDAENDVLAVRLTDDELGAREPAAPPPQAAGLGRELFQVFRRAATEAEDGASSLFE